MKPVRKRPLLDNFVGETSTGLRDMFINQPAAKLNMVRERFHDLPKSNYAMGLDFMAQGKWFDAMFRFRVVNMLRPNYPGVWYQLGCCYYRMGDVPKAKMALRKALAQEPGNPDIQFMLALADPAALPTPPLRVPTTMVTAFFSGMAPGYDVAEANNRYQAGKIIHDITKPLVSAASPAVLDLGCGSGIAARPWRAAASSITGVDSTPAMLALADAATHAEKKLFDTLVTADITALPVSVLEAKHDVVLVVNVAQFMGPLDGLLAQVARTLASGGVAVLTVEPWLQAGGYGLSPRSSRFGHAPAYVAQAARGAGLAVLKEEKVELYAGIPALAFVLGAAA